jgi:hypothetical protein
MLKDLFERGPSQFPSNETNFASRFSEKDGEVATP